MPDPIISDYFYGDESEQFVFFKIPRQLIISPKFKHVSTDAKLLYGMLLDRMSLSAKNDWYDDTGRVYIYYTLERKSMSNALPPGLPRPRRPRNPLRPVQRSIYSTSRSRKNRRQEVGKADVQRSDYPTLIILRKTRRNGFSLIHPSLPRGPPRRRGWIDTR